MIEGGARDLHRFREKEDALELPCRNAAMEMKALPIVFVTAADQKLFLFYNDLYLIGAESRDSQRNA